MNAHIAGGDEEYENYFRKVELGWSLARGCQIIVSPIEFEEIEKWCEGGIPLPVVLHAIELFIEKKKKAKRKRGFLLKDVSGTVEKCWREYSDIHAGEGEEGDLLANKMKGLLRKVRAIAKAFPEEQGYVDGLVADLKAVHLADVVHFDAIDSRISQLESAMVTHFTAKLTADELAEIRDEVGEFLEEEEDPAFFQKMLADAVRAHFALPKLSLLG